MKMKKLAACAALLGASLCANAQGFQVNLQGQQQQGMGGTGTGLIQDAAVVFFNPGGMSFLPGNHVSLGVSPTLSYGKFLDANNGSLAQTHSPVSYPFTGYAVFGCRDSSKLKFGLGAYTPFGSTMQWEDGWTGRFILTKLQLFAVYIQPTLSYKITEKLGIGAGFVIAPGKVVLQRDIPVQDANGNYGKADLSGNAMGYGFNGGIYYQATPAFSIGLTYRSQVKMKVKDGQANFTVPPSLASSFPSGAFTSSLPLPQVITLGLGYKASEKLTFAFDANFIGWSAYDTLAFDYANNTTTLKDTKSPRDYKNTFAFRLGAQYKLMEGFHARLGLSYLISPIKDGYVTPEVPDATRLNYTGGLGYTIAGVFSIDASFTFENLKRTDTNKESNLSGTYKTYVFIPGLSLAYKF